MNASDPLSLMKNYPVLLQRIAFAHFDFDVVSSDKNYPISVRPGRVDPRSGGRPDFTIKASSETWAEFAKATPRPGFNDVIA